MEISQITTIPDVVNALKVLVTGLLAFMLAFALTPLWTHVLYKYKIGIRIKQCGVQGDALVHVPTLHAQKSGTPTMGGVLVWGSVALLIFASEYIFPLLAPLFGSHFVARLDFLDRAQTWLPLFALIAAGLLGLADDWMSVKGIGKNKGGGIRFIMRFWWLATIAGLGAWWFYEKLEWSEIHVPAMGNFDIGWWYIPLFIFVILFSAISSNETDGLDGLNGGVLFMAFSAFAMIAFLHNQVNLAAFCTAIAGALLAFLWFNIYPARFFMGDTGAMSLGTTLGVVALLTNSVIALFIIVFLYVLESGSVVVQLTSKRFFGRKVLRAAPLHHHFEALGWQEPKIVMRAWVFTIVTTVFGLIVAILGMGG